MTADHRQAAIDALHWAKDSLTEAAQESTTEGADHALHYAQTNALIAIGHALIAALPTPEPTKEPEPFEVDEPVKIGSPFCPSMLHLGPIDIVCDREVSHEGMHAATVTGSGVRW